MDFLAESMRSLGEKSIDKMPRNGPERLAVLKVHTLAVVCVVMVCGTKTWLDVFPFARGFLGCCGAGSLR